MHSIYVYTDIYQGLNFFANSCIYILYTVFTLLNTGAVYFFFRVRKEVFIRERRLFERGVYSRGGVY